MAMHDWNGYRVEVLAGIGEPGKLRPDMVRGDATLSGAELTAAHLDAKTRELIAFGFAVSLRWDGWITVHANAARS